MSRAAEPRTSRPSPAAGDDDAGSVRGAVRVAADRARGALRAARRAVARALGGDRPLVAGLLAVLVLALVTVSGPLQNYLGAQERVATLRAQAGALEQANERLRQRSRDLRDPDHIELLARAEHDMIYPGQEAYTIVPPDTERSEQVVDEPVPARREPAWYLRAWRAVQDLVG